jgi:hypothetical protein
LHIEYSPIFAGIASSPEQVSRANSFKFDFTRR